MSGFTIFLWVVGGWVLLSLSSIPLLLAYRLGKKAGDQEGYLRGLREGQSSSSR